VSTPAPPERHSSWHELFFDLVFVAVIAALAGVLQNDHSPTGLLVFVGLFVPVWWVWRGYTWYAAAFGSADDIFRLALFVAMLGAGALAVGAEGAAHGHSDTFVVACAGVFALLACLYARIWFTRSDARPHAVRYASGNALGAAIWLVSLAFSEELRPVVWAVAMLVLVAPALAVLALPYRAYADAGHIAERYGLFTIIVLGESVVRTIAGLQSGAGTTAAVVAIVGAMLAATIWWVYFGWFRSMPDVSRGARFVWAQAHFFVFAGIAAAAVGVELLIETAADGGLTTFDERLTLSAGLACYLSGMAIIRAAARKPDPIVALRVTTAAVLLALSSIGGLSAPAFVAIAAAVMAIEAYVEPNSAPPAE
jgi:low temperature requirement protein LtrA